MSVKQWEADANKFLKGKTIKRVRYMTEAEKDAYMWEEAALVIYFTDGHYILASQDDEGNGPGSLFTSSDKMPTIPAI